ncbi:MAG: hypothetical protein ACTHK0_12740 [Ginsengibacter sp.]
MVYYGVKYPHDQKQKSNKQEGKMRKLSLFIATSLDGYIAKPNDDLSFLKLVEKEGEDYGYPDFIATIKPVITSGTFLPSFQP